MVGLIARLIALATLALAPWWVSLSLIIVLSLFGTSLVYALASSHNLRDRAAQPLTRLACDDSEFFRFAVERGLIQIDHVAR